MNVHIPSQVIKVIESVKRGGHEVYVVGGGVHDLIMNRMVDDWDFTTSASPNEILKIFPKGVYDNAFGTVMLPNEITETPFDITTFRTEHGYSDSRRPDKVKWGKSLQDDLKRRDFTINAMALKIPKLKSKSGKYNVEVIDPYKGQSDIKNKLIKAVGNPNERFSEDALRMMRAIRIAAELGFKIEDKTFEAINTNANLINKIAKERVRDELLKILSSPYPYEGMMLFRNAGLMKQILPELVKTFGVEQKSPGRHHIYDVGTHSIYSLKYVAEKNQDPIVRFATLIHDVGKPQTYKKLKNGTITFYNHEVVSGRIAKRIASRLKFSNKQSEKFWLLVRYHQFSVNENQTDSAIRRFIKRTGKENIKDMIDLRVGDRLGGGARETSWRLEEFKKRLVEVQKQPFTIHDLKITGHDIMKELKLKPGPEVGNILEKLFDYVVKKKIPNEKSKLINKLKKMAT